MSDQFDFPPPGSVVSVAAYGPYRHKFIVSDLWFGGKPMGISYSASNGGFAEEPWDVCTGGQAWRDEGYLGSLEPGQVLYRARYSSRRPYNVLTWNCENFVNMCHGLSPISQQVVATLLVAVVGVLAAANAKLLASAA